MTSSRELLNLNVYAPALVGDDRRPLTILHGMERAFPGLRLAWTLSEKGKLIALTQRDDWFAVNRTDDGLPFLCNDDESRPVTLTGWENPSGLAGGSLPSLDVHATLPLDAGDIAVAVDVLEAIGEGARAVWGHASPWGYNEVVSRQFRDSKDEPHVAPRGLPWLLRPPYNISPEFPHYLGWLNYWSATAARAMGFPDPMCDTDLLSRSRRTATGGWVVQLTDAPLDLDDSTHLDALKRAYTRFPKVGGRAAY